MSNLSYRTTNGPPRAPIRVVSVLGAPQIVILSTSLDILLTPLICPANQTFLVGQNAYHLEASSQTEYAPIITTLVGPHGKSHKSCKLILENRVSLIFVYRL